MDDRSPTDPEDLSREDPTPEDLAALRRAARGGLCGACRHARLVRSARGSVFARCVHPDLPKYPGQPVLRCHGFARADAPDA